MYKQSTATNSAARKSTAPQALPEQSPIAIVLQLLLLLFLCKGAAQAAEATGAQWQGNDLIVSFSDSISFRTDLVASDSSQLVIRLEGAVPGAMLRNAGEIPGPGRKRAILTRAADSVLRLTLIDTGRLGYSLLWRPYSHRLIIHTFNWEKLGYGEEQYHKGLLALEEGLNVQAEELLTVAYATGYDQAASVLGVYYARNGRDSLAARYLRNPIDADDHAAAAELQSRHGDVAGAQAQQERFKEMLADGDSAANQSGPVGDGRGNASTGTDIMADPTILGVGLGVLVLIILLITWSIRRGSRMEQKKAERLRRESAHRPAESSATGLSPAEPTVPVAEAQPAPSQPTPVAGPPVAVEPVTAVEPEPVPPPVVPEEAAKPEPAPRRSVFTRADIFREAPRTDTPLTEATSHVPHPVATASELEHAQETLRDPELHLSPDEGAGRHEAYDRNVPPAAPETAPLPTAADAAPAVTEAPPVAPSATPSEPQATVEGAASDPRARVLSTQARDLQRKIQSRRPDQPAPAEPTKSAARRLNISRDNVELRRMIESAPKRGNGSERPEGV